MSRNSADANELAQVRRLASDPSRVRITRTAEYDLLANRLTKVDICDEIIAWIDKGERVKKVTLRGQHAGQAAYDETTYQRFDVLFEGYVVRVG